MTKQLQALSVVADGQGQRSTQARVASVDLSMTSPNQRPYENQRIFIAAATDLVQQFLPTEPNPDAFIQILRGTAPTPRMAWTRVLQSVAVSFEQMVNYQIRPALQRLIEAFRAGDTTHSLNSHLILLKQNVEALDKAIHNVNVDFDVD